jgi:uncharacterized membrane protein
MAKEIGWGKAFKYAGKFIVYAIVWLIIGFIFTAAGLAIISSSLQLAGSLFPQITYDVGKLFAGIILLIVGWLIAALGVTASYFKIMSALIAESVSGENLPAPPLL